MNTKQKQKLNNYISNKNKKRLTFISKLNENNFFKCFFSLLNTGIFFLHKFQIKKMSRFLSCKMLLGTSSIFLKTSFWNY
jgi:hypothetical protein